VDTIMSTTNPAPRRRTYTTEFRQGLVAQCQPGVSVSRIALAHGINTNLLRKWIDRYRNQLPASAKTFKSAMPQAQVGQLSSRAERQHLTSLKRTVALIH
jgi:transposase-like protein